MFTLASHPDLGQSLEVRLHRALEEVSKQKEALREARGQKKGLGQEQRLEVTRLEGQCQRLERQKVSPTVVGDGTVIRGALRIPVDRNSSIR